MRCKVTVIVDAVLVATFLAPWRVKLLMDEADDRGYRSNKTTGSSLIGAQFTVLNLILRMEKNFNFEKHSFF